MVTPGQQIELQIEKPAAGGRMIARHEGQVVFVLGAIPGERISARVERVERQLAFATAVEVLEGSPDRRPRHGDLLCGGCLYAHIEYPRQRSIKSEVIRDTFARIGRVNVEEPVDVAPSPERGYRMRARLHVRDGKTGFYREGTHALCDAAGTAQLTADAIRAASATVEALGAAGIHVSSAEISENISATQRALSFESPDRVPPDVTVIDSVATTEGVSGWTLRTAAGEVRGGIATVSDPLAVLTRGRAGAGSLSRHVQSFFQANRFLLPDLVTTVLDAVLAEGDVLDLYAGVGLFSVALAATGRTGITAVEGDFRSGNDLQRNAAPFGAAIAVVLGSVETPLQRTGAPPQTIVVDPPRTGISRRAVEVIARGGARRIVYVSCDPPTMARDARRFLDAGYALLSLRAFDLFPNTPHVESVGVFEQGR